MLVNIQLKTYEMGKIDFLFFKKSVFFHFRQNMFFEKYFFLVIQSDVTLSKTNIVKAQSVTVFFSSKHSDLLFWGGFF